MKIIRCKDSRSASEEISTWLQKKQQKYQAESLFIPAGSTPVELYRYWEATHPSFLQKLRLMQVDDILTTSRAGEFSRFLKEHLPSFANQITGVGGGSDTADLAILGLGINGHVAFHEPDLPPSFFSGCVPLSQKTQEYLSLDEPAWGVTYGLASFQSYRALALLCWGSHKAKVLSEVIARGPVPAGRLMGHNDLTIFADEEALSLVDEGSL